MERITHPQCRSDANGRYCSFRIPASLLIFGEYWITQYGGIGVSTVGEEDAYVHICSGQQDVQPSEQHPSENVFHLVYTHMTEENEQLKMLSKEDFDQLTFRDPEKSMFLGAYLRCLCKPMVGNNDHVYRMWHACLTTCFAALDLQNLQGDDVRCLYGSCIIDTEAFFHSDARSGSSGSRALQKKGLSSSACSCIAMCACIWTLAKRDPLDDSARFTAAAIRAHACFQGGGSGYDVLTSYLGKTVIFLQETKGASCSEISTKNKMQDLSETRCLDEQYRQFQLLAQTHQQAVCTNGLLTWIGLPAFFTIHALHHGAPVSTKDAVQRFQTFAQKNALLVRHLLCQSNNTIIELVGLAGRKQKLLKSDRSVLAMYINSLIYIGEIIGACIGVPATFSDDIRQELLKKREEEDDVIWYFCKSLGAGNEVLGLLSIRHG